MGHDAIIIGGGMVGAATAFGLTRNGAKTLLIDRDDPGRATDAGAGILAPETSGLGRGHEWFTFGLRAGEYYRSLIAQLEDDGITNTGYATCGILIIAVSDDETSKFEALRQTLHERQAKYGIPAADTLRDISPEEARELFPPLGEIRHGLHHTGAARVDGKLLRAALLRGASLHGLQTRTASADEFIIAEGRVCGIIVDGEPVEAERVIITGGAWSARFANQLGISLPLKPQRGQIIHLKVDFTDTRNWPIVEPLRDHYLVAWEDSRVVAGATRESNSGFAPRQTASGLHEVLNEALRVAPGLSGAEIAEVRVGLRPVTSDGLPVIGTFPHLEGLYIATGHGANGLLLGPYSGQLAADWALGNPPDFDMTPFSVARFNNSTLSLG